MGGGRGGNSDGDDGSGRGEDEHQIFVKFFKFHCSYDLIPTSAKLVVFDTQVIILIN